MALDDHLPSLFILQLRLQVAQLGKTSSDPRIFFLCLPKFFQAFAEKLQALADLRQAQIDFSRDPSVLILMYKAQNWSRRRFGIPAMITPPACLF